MGFIWQKHFFAAAATAMLTCVMACEPLQVDQANSSGGTKTTFTLTSVTPAIANIAGGAELDIIGDGFTEDSVVAIDGFKCLDQNLVSAKEIKCTVPQMNGNGSVKLTVYEKLDGKSLEIAFTLTDTPAPSITGFYTDDTADGIHKLKLDGSSKLTLLVRNATSSNSKIYVGDATCVIGTTPAALAIVCTPPKSLPKTAKVRLVTADGQQFESPDTIEYVGLITQPLLLDQVWKSNCTGCHGTTVRSANLNLNTITEPTADIKLKIQNRVRLNASDSGFMPQDAAAQLSSEILHAIDLWIDPSTP